MVEKEERICINEFKPNCIHLKSSVIEFRDGFVDEQVYCELTRNKCVEKNCKKIKYDTTYGITKKEAIEVMAKAMYNRFLYGKTTRRYFLEYAEAALNALLKGVKK